MVLFPFLQSSQIEIHFPVIVVNGQYYLAITFQYYLLQSKYKYI